MCKQFDEDDVIAGLQTIRVSLSRQEKEYIDYACDCVQKIKDLREYIKAHREET